MAGPTGKDISRPIIELRDPVHGPIPVGRGELNIIDTPVFQRLRGIKQLGFAEFVFPGAVHHRYLHSIGAMHVGGQVIGQVLADAALPDAERRRLYQLVRLAALLHDIGHAPMSHAAESLLPLLKDLKLRPGLPGAGHAVGGGGSESPDGGVRAGHEDMTLKLITDSVLTDVLIESFGGMGITPEDVAAVIADAPGSQAERFVVETTGGPVDYWPLCHAMVSGEMDVDRMDYLLRDSYFAGVRYGQYDKSWLISNARCVIDPQWAAGSARSARLGIDLRAVASFEHFLLARYHMFQMVYFHPKSDIYDGMLRRWLKSVGDDARFPADSAAYTLCDDAWLNQRLRESDDPWAKRIRERKPYHLLAELRTAEERDSKASIAAALRVAGVEGLWLEARPVLSRYARSPKHLRTNPLLVVDTKPAIGQVRHYRIEEVTDLFDRYERTIELSRVYVPPHQRVAARRALDTLMAA